MLLLLLPVALFFFKTLPMARADSTNGLNQGNGTPFMPMMGAFGGAGSDRPFSPIRSGIVRFPSQGHEVTTNPDHCKTFHYNSNPPSSGLMMNGFLPKNDLPVEAVSPCILSNVIRKGNIVIYYDPARVSAQAISGLHGISGSDLPAESFLSQQKLGYGVLLVKARFKDPILLVAWRRMLPLSFLDRIKTNMFLAKYRGRIERKN